MLNLNPAHADQCGYLDYETFLRAYDLFKNTDVYIDYCPLCDDSIPTEKSIEKLGYKKIQGSKDAQFYYEIYINDDPIDLAYAYIDGRNVGILVKCGEIIGVPEFIDN